MSAHHPSESRQARWLPVISASLAVSVVFVAVLAIPAQVADTLGLSGSQFAAWIVGLYGISAVLGIAFALRYRVPLLVTGNIFVLIFVSRLGNDFSWSELVGASMTAGVVVLALTMLGVVDRLGTLLPAPIVYGLLAGAVLPFFTRMFSLLGDERIVIGGTLAAFLVAKRLFEPRVPGLLVALAAWAALVVVTGGVTPPEAAPWSLPTLTMPTFSLQAIITATPVIVVLITVQANLPSLVYLRSKGFSPPVHAVNTASGAGTLLASLLGPIGISLSLPATALVAGDDAGPHHLRHRSVYIAGAVALTIALAAVFANALLTALPQALIAAVVGLAVVGVLLMSLKEMTRGPLVLGPLFAFAVALSDLTLFGLGPFFWALVIGIATSLLLEHDAWAELRRTATP